MSETMDIEGAGGIEDVALDEHASRQYLSYAVSVVRSRALPEIADGFKPVQRRIIYAMSESSGNGWAKSARYVGDVLGKYHPHGDTSVYDALVHMTQPFVMRYPVIEGQGNFGSRDGDGAAAMRYTEAKLSRFADLLLAEINEGTVDWQKNYDGKFEEPAVFPARLPFGLLNGSFGIPVGFSTNIPSHNLREVARACVAALKNPEITAREVSKLIPGPDFPGGARIISSREELRQIYETGRGSITMRAKWEIEPMARGQWRVVVTELPHGVSKKQILEEIEALVNPRPQKDKKEASQEQKRLKQFFLDLLDGVRDESDRKSGMRLIIEPRSSRQDQDELMKALLAHTSLESRVSVNLTLIDRHGYPETMPIDQMILQWCEIRLHTVRRRTTFRMQKAEDRLHIVEGRLIAFAHIDEIIKVIRASEDQADARARLQKKWKFTETQSEDIVNLRLGQLTKLDGVKLNDEKKALQREIAGYRKLLDSDAEMRALVIEEIESDAEKYGDARRTEIRADERTEFVQTVKEDPLTVILSKKGWIRARTGHGVDMGTLAFKDGDALLHAIECKTTDHAVLLGASGRVFSVDVSLLPTGRGDGVPVNSLVNSGSDAIVWMGAGNPDQAFILHTTGGQGFICKLGDMVTRLKAGKEFLTVPDGARVLPPLPIGAIESKTPACVAALSSDQRLLVFPRDELVVRANGGLGVQLMALPDGVHLVALTLTDGKALSVKGVRRGKAGTFPVDDEVLAGSHGKRAQRGRLIDAKTQVKGFA